MAIKLKKKGKQEGVPWLPVGHFSVSQARMYMKCPRQYYFRYVLGIKDRPSVPLDEGLSHHEWLEVNNNTHIEKGVNLREPEARDIFNEKWHTRARENKHAKYVQREVRERGKTLVRKYLEFADKHEMQPDSAEKGFTLEIAGAPVIGYIDYIGKFKDRDGKKKSGILDFKVVKSKKSKTDIDNDIQNALYAEAEGKLVGGFVSLTKQVTPQVDVITAHMTRKRKDWAKAVIASVIRTVRRAVDVETVDPEDFPLCDPSSWHCSSKWCGYWKRCRGK